MNKKYFGECAYWRDEKEKIEAKTYLEFWKKNLLFKLQRDSFVIEIVDEQWIERPPEIVSMLAQYGTIGLKLHLKADFHYELGN